MKPARNYCHVLNPHKHNRNLGCRLHDNAYGINGGGAEQDRWRADRALYAFMLAEGDPMALPAYLACTCLGWFFFNYHPGRGLWRGQILRRFFKAPD